MNKRILILITAFLLIFSSLFMSSCAKNQETKIVIAKIDDIEIYKSVFTNAWENYKEQAGITDEVLANAEYTAQIEDTKHQLLEYLVKEEIIKMHLKELGFYDLTDTEYGSALTQKESLINNALSLKQEEIFQELGANYTSEEYVNMENIYIQKILDEYNITEEELLSYYIDEIALANAKAALVVVDITEDDVQGLYDQYLQEDTDFFTEDPAAFEYYYMEGNYSIYYTPEGFRYIRHLLIQFDDEAISSISALRDAGDNDGADAIQARAAEAIQEEADEALALLTSGDITMDEAIAEYNDDPGMVSYTTGYIMYKDSTSYVPEFTEAGMALENIGDISGLVLTDYGYHILEYSSAVESGPIDIDLVRDELYNELVGVRNDEIWTNQIDAWIAMHTILYYYENLTEEIAENTVAE